jgi:phenylalanyl-tRNA synthetase alpha chain
VERVFRNETLDATHLAEFHQVEGIVADYDLSLGDLIGVLSEFFEALGRCCGACHVRLQCSASMPVT